MAYRYLARNQPIPHQVSMALQGKRPDGLPQCPTPPPSSGYSQGIGGIPQVYLNDIFHIINLIKHNCIC